MTMRGDDLVEARFYEREKENKLRCKLCPHFCLIDPDNTGICTVRRNEDGVLKTLNYGQVTSAAMDPIEKKPLYHYDPGSVTLSLGTRGCNLSCSFCQNWRISQGSPRTRYYSPAGVVEMAGEKNSSTITFTYSEPVVWFEYIEDVAQRAAERGLGIILVTNGFINPRPLQELIPYLSACNIDLKAMSAEFYRKHCGGGGPDPVRKTITSLHEAGVHLEVTNLLLPGENDGVEQLEDLCEFIADLSPEIPLHISRYFPRHRLKLGKTPAEVMERSFDLARKHLNYVYLGNIDHPRGRITYCPECSEELIDRSYFNLKNRLESGECPHCGREISGVFNK